MTKEQLKQLFKKLFILKFAPREEWEFEIYLDEFKDCDFELFKLTIDRIMKSCEEFPKPATIWRFYFELKNDYDKKNQLILHCDKCFKVYFTRKDKIKDIDELYCPECKNKLCT